MTTKKRATAAAAAEQIPRLDAGATHAVTVIGEKQFWKLAVPVARSRKVKRTGKATRRA